MKNNLRSHVTSAFTSLCRDQKAAVLPIFGLMVIFLVVVAGAAIDISRVVNAREKLSYAIDVAALSVATDLSTSALSDAQIKARLEASFRANLADAEFLEKAIENLNFDVNSNQGTVSVTSSAALDNYFIDMGGYGIKAFGPEAFSFGTSAQVSYSQFDVELALVVDVTGSMSGDMGTLRTASKAVVDILRPADIDEKDAKVRISLVPYSRGVNLGSFASKAKGGDFYAVSGKCVTEREDYETFKVKFTDTTYNYYEVSAPPPKETFFGDGTSGRCPSRSEMIPLTKDRDKLKEAITDLSAGGATAGQTGAIWGWNSISPNFANLWPAESAPAAYTDDNVLKFAIIMTDGDNNRAYDLVDRQCYRWGCVDYDPPRWQETSRGASGYRGTASVRHREYCKGMKESGIEVFGVYFGSNNSSTGARNMQSCASTGNYYQASSSQDLINAFANIAKKIQQIYLSK